jgi:hypothetical protein
MPDYSKEIEDLARSIRQRRALLFVGAGISMSVGLPSWDRLIQHMVEELGIDPAIVDHRQGSHQTIAEYYRLKRGSLGPLRSWLDRNWVVSHDMVEASRLHRLIVDLDFPAIYTTNYDRNLEVAFEIHGKPYAKVANARDIAQADPDVPTIVKFHGDFDDDASLVLTETDYFDRLAFDSPLDVRFRADALGKAILFIGYSLSDMNIRLLLHRLWQTWHRAGCEADRPQSFVFMARHNPVEEAVLKRWGITMISPDGERDVEEATCRFLSELKEAVDAGRREEN